MRVASLATLALLSLAACAAPPPAVDTAGDEQAIRDLNVTWDASYNARDLETLVGLYEGDATLMAPNVPSSVGSAQIGAGFEADWATNAAGPLENRIDELHVSGDLAMARGSGGATINPSNGSEAYQDSWKWSAVYRRQADGSWLTVWDIWNSDRAPQP